MAPVSFLNMKCVLSLLILVASLYGCQSGPAYKLRLHYQKGETFKVEYHVYAGSDEEKGLINHKTKMTFRVDSITADSLYILSAKVTSLRMYNSGLMSQQYSSEKDTMEMSAEEKNLHEDFRPVLDSTYQLTINNRGEIVEPFKYKGSKSKSRVSSPIDYENCQVPFPKEAVSIGDSWTTERAVPLVGGKRISKYTFAGVKDSVILIEVSGNIELSIGIKNGFSGKYSLNQRAKTLILADIETEMQSIRSGKTRLYIKSR